MERTRRRSMEQWWPDNEWFVAVLRVGEKAGMHRLEFLWCPNGQEYQMTKRPGFQWRKIGEEYQGYGYDLLENWVKEYCDPSRYRDEIGEGC